MYSVQGGRPSFLGIHTKGGVLVGEIKVREVFSEMGSLMRDLHRFENLSSTKDLEGTGRGGPKTKRTSKNWQRDRCASKGRGG